MANLKLRYLIAILLLAASTLIVYNLQYDSSNDDETGLAILQTIPMQFAQWKGHDLPLDETVYEILETRAIIHRSFISEKGDTVFLSVVHYHDTKVDFHAPEACLGGRGEKTEKRTKTITVFPSSQKRIIDIAEIIASGATDKTLTYYFFKSGQFIGENYIKMRLSIAANKLARNDTRGSLVRVSTTLVPGNETMAESRLIGFIEDLLPYVQQSL